MSYTKAEAEYDGAYEDGRLEGIGQAITKLEDLIDVTEDKTEKASLKTTLVKLQELYNQ